MRTLGVSLLGLGLTIWFPCAFLIPLFSEFRQWSEVAGWFVCSWVIPFPLMLLGIILIRRVEDGHEREYVERSLHSAPRWLSPASLRDDDDILSRAHRFDLNCLNWIGWLLFLATCQLIAAEILVQALIHPLASFLIPVSLMVIFPIVFFEGMRRLLLMFKVSIFRSGNAGARRSAKD